MTQSSGGSQLTPEQKFYQNAEVMPLRKMVQLSEVIIFTYSDSVATVDFIPYNKHVTYYL
jgi:hypothetical protein